MDRIENVRWGISKGLIMGGLYCVFAAVLYLLGGPGRFERTGINIVALCSVYLGGGFGAGIVLGLLRNALDDRTTATFVSVLAALPLSFGMTLLTRHKAISEWGEREVLIVLLGALLVGFLAMAVLWKDRDFL